MEITVSDSDLQTTHDLSVHTDSPTTSDQVIRLDEPKRPRLGSDFVRLWAATAASNVGDGVRITALPLLAAFLTRSPVLISGVLIATRLPWLLFSLHAGAIADRVDRKQLIVRVNIGRALVMGLLALSVATGFGGLAALYLVALLQGIGEVFSDNTSFAMVPSVVPKERLEDANGRLEGAIIVTNEFAGPALGALLFAHWASVPFAIDAATFVIAAWFFAGIKVTSQPRQEVSTTVGQDIRTGLKWLRSHTLLRNLTVIASLTNLALQATFAIQVLFVLNTLGLSATGFGLDNGSGSRRFADRQFRRRTHEASPRDEDDGGHRARNSRDRKPRSRHDWVVERRRRDVDRDDLRRSGMEHRYQLVATDGRPRRTPRARSECTPAVLLGSHAARSAHRRDHCLGLRAPCPVLPGRRSPVHHDDRSRRPAASRSAGHDPALS